MTTTICLPDEWKARIDAMPERSGKSLDSLRLEAIMEKVLQEGQQSDFDAEADEPFAGILAPGQSIAWDDLRAYLEDRIAGKSATRPAARKLGQSSWRVSNLPHESNATSTVFSTISPNVADKQARMDEIVRAIAMPGHNPLIGVPTSDGRRELVIGRRTHGYVALYHDAEKTDAALLLAIRHQREARWPRGGHEAPGSRRIALNAPLRGLVARQLIRQLDAIALGLELRARPRHIVAKARRLITGPHRLAHLANQFDRIRVGAAPGQRDELRHRALLDDEGVRAAGRRRRVGQRRALAIAARGVLEGRVQIALPAIS